ncbi:FkbM family methyltransferase [Natronomonas salina]|uniref:FkbM family methyltransferase n=1 Tax=Natronomonas salina TaxID=1710540 RepID=UPI0015B44230|nr:FkbM family methyltransferase [Natronomonas salina]QLD90787.1 FkbM family methyltransferase [Natronomonas salina]
MSIRPVELYSEGGLSEVQRGVTDWYLYKIKRPVFTQIKDTSQIKVDDVEIEWTIANQESASRAIGISETVVMEDFVKNVDEGKVFWDVGANQGIYSMLAAEQDLDVHAFEPGEKARSILRENEALNDVDVNVHSFALSDEDGEKTLAKTGNTGTRSLVSDGEQDGDTVQIKRGESVDAPTPDVMKIDVEGHELKVLDGLGECLDACQLCYVEVHDDAELDEVETILINHDFDDINHLPDPNTIVKGVTPST